MTDDGGPRDRITGADSVAEELDETFDLLGSRRRRAALAHLADVDDDQVALEELAEAVLDCEHAAVGRRDDGSDAPRASTRDVYNDLYHAHVPRLSSAGVASYVESEDAVRVETVPEPLTRILETARELERAECEK